MLGTLFSALGLGATEGPTATARHHAITPSRGTSAPVDVPPDSPEQKRAIVQVLLEHAKTLDPDITGLVPSAATGG